MQLVIDGTTIEFSVEVEGGMLPHPSRADAEVRRYRCKATVASLAALGALDAAVAQATYERPLGMSLWVAIIDSGDRGVLTIPLAGQGEASGQTAVYANAILTRVEARGSAYVAGRFRVDLDFALPDLVS